VTRALDEPQRDIVELLRVFGRAKNCWVVGLLLSRLHARAHVRRVADKVDLIRAVIRAHLVPVDTGGITRAYLPRFLQRDQRDGNAELLVELAVHLVLGDPHRDDRHLDGEVVNLDAVEILDIDARLVEQHIVRTQILLPLQDRVLQTAQFLVRDDQEVPRTTGRVENLDARNAVKQALQLPWAVEGSVEFLLELVEEEWLNRLQDIQHRGVVLLQVGAQLRGDDRLEYRTEYSRVDVQPDLPTELNEQLAGHPRKTGDSQLCVRPEEPTVHIGEARQVGGLLRRVCLVEGREEILDEVRGIGAVLKRVGTHRIGELVFGEDPGVLSEIRSEERRVGKERRAGGGRT